MRQPRNKVRRNGIDVVIDGGPGLVAGHDQTGEVLVEQVADDLDQHVGLFVQRDRGTGRLLLGLDRLGLDLRPSFLQPADVGADVVFLDPLGGGADDHAGFRRNHFAQNLFEPLTFGVGQLAADPGGRRTRDVNQIAAGQRDLGGQPRALVPDRILADLDDDIVTRLEGLLDLAVRRRRDLLPPS